MSKSLDLADYVREKMAEKNLSTYDIQKASGNRITAPTVTKIINRDIRSNGLDTLTGLAAGLGVSAEEVINIARGIAAKPSRFEIYADTFDAHDLSDSEWQMLESHFNDYVKTWQRFQKERTKVADTPPERKLAPVVAHIGPGDLTKAEAQKMIDSADIREIEKRVTPKRKTG